MKPLNKSRFDYIQKKYCLFKKLKKPSKAIEEVKLGKSVISQVHNVVNGEDLDLKQNETNYEPCEVEKSLCFSEYMKEENDQNNRSCEEYQIIKKELQKKYQKMTQIKPKIHKRVNMKLQYWNSLKNVTKIPKTNTLKNKKQKKNSMAPQKEMALKGLADFQSFIQKNMILKGTTNQNIN
jgi:hypothetical protein